MAKDPAFLFYPGDWQGGTSTFTRHLKGCYLDILIAQFNSGPLSIEEIKTVLGTDFAAWGTLSKKFKKAENGLFFNEKLEQEKLKRKEFSKSRSENRSKGYKKSTYVGTSVEHMSLHMENENENIGLSTTVNYKERFFRDFENGIEIENMAKETETSLENLKKFIPAFSKKVRSEYNRYSDIVDHFKYSFLKSSYFNNNPDKPKMVH